MNELIIQLKKESGVSQIEEFLFEYTHQSLKTPVSIRISESEKSLIVFSYRGTILQATKENFEGLISLGLNPWALSIAKLIQEVETGNCRQEPSR